MIHVDALDFSECHSEEVILTLSVHICERVERASLENFRLFTFRNCHFFQYFVGANIHDEMCEVANFVLNIDWRQYSQPNSRLLAHFDRIFGRIFISSTGLCGLSNAHIDSRQNLRFHTFVVNIGANIHDSSWISSFILANILVFTMKLRLRRVNREYRRQYSRRNSRLVVNILAPIFTTKFTTRRYSRRICDFGHFVVNIGADIHDLLCPFRATTSVESQKGVIVVQRSMAIAPFWFSVDMEPVAGHLQPSMKFSRYCSQGGQRWGYILEVRLK